MGYQPSRKLYNLQFEDYPGLEITASGTSLGKLMHLASLDLKLNDPDEEKRMEVFKIFAAQLVSWNMEHPELETPEEDGTGGFICFNCKQAEGAPMACNLMSLLCLELSFITQIIFGWMGAIARVSVPKELNLSDGGKSMEEAMMRLVQHQNLSTLPTPNLS